MMMMNKLFLLVITFLLFQNATCHKEESVNCIKVKVHGFICAQTILEILDPSFKHLGENKWKQPDGTELNYVFKGNLGSCIDITSVKSDIVGKTIDIELLDSFDTKSGTGCAVCEAYLMGPKTERLVKICK